jgi:hypothetical protein
MYFHISVMLLATEYQVSEQVDGLIYGPPPSPDMSQLVLGGKAARKGQSVPSPQK